MAINPNMKLIEAKTVGAGGVAYIEFTSIPQTYTDLKILLSARLSANGDTFGNTKISFNGSPAGTVYSAQNVRGNGASTFSQNYTSQDSIVNNYSVVGSTATASMFSNTEIYIPNYTSTTTAKIIGIDNATENNATDANLTLAHGLWNPGTQAAITSIRLTANYSSSELYVENTTVYLYGITSAGVGVKATGGQIMQDANYFYHVFASSGVFTPSTNLTCDYLVIAGGGAGGTIAGNQVTGAGGGAGGLRSTVGATGGGGSLESALSLTSGTGYTVTIGGGGAIGTWPTRGSSGSNSVFSTITSAGGGAGGIYAPSLQNGVSGGSGGGGSHINGTGGSPSPSGQGYAGGNGSSTNNNGSGGGGGGAGAIGSNATVGAGQAGGAGGNGVAISAYANATATGVNTYYAGGGGGGSTGGFAPASGGLGGGGNGAVSNIVGGTGIANTGGGGGGGQYAQLTAYNPGAGGSGLVIVRYAK